MSLFFSHIQALFMARHRQQATSELQEILGYTFNDLPTLWAALQISGYNTCRGRRGGVPRRTTLRTIHGILATLGREGIAKVAIDYCSFLGFPEAEIYRILVMTLSNSNLARLSIRHGFRRFIRMNPSLWGPCRCVVWDTVLAVLGAVFMDGGYDAFCAVIETLDVFKVSN